MQAIFSMINGALHCTMHGRKVDALLEINTHFNASIVRGAFMEPRLLRNSGPNHFYHKQQTEREHLIA